LDPERERKAQEFAIRQSDDLAAEWTRTEARLRASAPALDEGAIAAEFVAVLQRRIDALIEGYLKHAIDEPYTKYDREFLARMATEEATRVVEHVRERFGDAMANEHRVPIEAHAVEALKRHLDPL
jgi:hypothetical protein